jgi:hypothetical protein
MMEGRIHYAPKIWNDNFKEEIQMSEEKRLKARVVHKHKTYTEWYLDVYDESGKLRSNPFIPLDGELIIFDPDENCIHRRKKYGDGVSNVMELPFAEEIYIGDGDMPENATVQIILDGEDEPGGVTDNAISEHNVDTTAHADIRGQISQLSSEKANKTYVDAQITTVKAEVKQQTPLFVNSIEECTDTTKLYVLPDGYIYAYTTGGTVEVFTDVLKTVGYTDDRRINSSGGIVEWTSSDADVTGYIPVKVGDVIRVKNMSIPSAYTSGVYWNSAGAYTSSKTFITKVPLLSTDVDQAPRIEQVEENGNIVQFTITPEEFGSDVAFIVINAKDITANSEVYVNSTFVGGNAWTNTGLAFVPADYEPRIIELEKEVAELGGTLTSSYWISELETKSQAIQKAIETAGSNKSAFLWYTDAHWQTNSKKSPLLLKYLIENTPINKINFGGDIINDPSGFTHDNIKYAYEWRKAIADLPNHHSVYGNHDLNHWSTDVSKMAYAFMLAHEEAPNMVVGGDSYYYIDNQSEKTRYLYLSYLTRNHDLMIAQGKFIVNALSSVEDGWHIVVIAHRWFQYTSSSAPTVGSVPNYEKEILSVFDAYNARATRSGSNYFTS